MRINHAQRVFLLSISFIAVLFILPGCNESTLLGGNIASGNGDTPAMETDTFTVRTKNIFRNQDSVYSATTTNVAAGTINDDPALGKTIAAVYSQFGLSQAGMSFSGPGPVLDSVVLSYGYIGHYGDSLNTQTFTVYQITDPSFTDTSLKYYLHQTFNIDQGNPLGTTTVNANSIEDSVTVFGIKQAPQLRIRLSDAFGEQLLQQTNNGALANDSAFHQWLNGLALMPDSTTAGKKSQLYLQLKSDYTGITVFYHNSTEDSLIAYFPFNPQTGAWSNYVQHDFQGAQVNTYLKDSSAIQDSLVFLQDKSGLYANISIPYLQDFPNALINKAELIITQVEDQDSSNFPPPYELFLWQYKDQAQDTIGYILDAGAVSSPNYGLQFTNLNYFGGLERLITNKNGNRVAQYKFNITRYLQHLISPSTHQQTNYGFRLGILDPQQRGLNIGRVILGGGNHSEFSMKLHVIYTKIQ